MGNRYASGVAQGEKILVDRLSGLDTLGERLLLVHMDHSKRCGCQGEGVAWV